MSSNPLTLIKNRLYLRQEIHRDWDFHSLHCVYITMVVEIDKTKSRRENIVWDLKHVEISEMSSYKCRLIRNKCI